MEQSRLQVIYSGRVHGVGFRYTAKMTARGFDVTGTVRNLSDGTVELIAEGARPELEAFREAVRMRTPRLHAQSRVKPRRLTLERLRKNERVTGLIDRLNRYLIGWHWYFKHIRLPFRQPFTATDEFVRRRLRSSIVGRTGNGWWTMQLTNAMLGKLGLVSVEGLHDAYLLTSRPAHARQG